MPSMASESVATIVCTSKQTRFHIGTPSYRELDIEGVNIAVTAARADKAGPKAKGKAKAKEGGLEILSSAKLRLKESAEFKAGREGPEERTALQEVVERVTARSAVEQEIKGLKHEKLQKQLFLMDKDARLRSGSRGLQARKALVSFEKVVSESNALLEQADDEISKEALQAETQEAADMLAELQIRVAPSRLAQVELEARKILAGLGFSDAQMDKKLSTLSGGWHMRTDLAAALLQEADILILDEPTNFLDLLGIVWLQKYLQSLYERAEKPPTLLLVSHDRDFISICTDLLILKDKDLAYFHGDLPTYEASQSERRQWLVKMKEAQDKQKAHIEKSIANNLRAGKANDDQNKIRQAKSRQKKLDDRWGLQVSARGGRFKLNRDLVGYFLTSREGIDIPPEQRPVVIDLPEPPDLRFPGSLISMDKASFRYAARAPLVIHEATLTVGMGDRIGICGLNGSGKSTLIKMLVGETLPTSGAVETHPRLRLGYYSQHAVEALKALAAEGGVGGGGEGPLTSLALLTREVDGKLSEGEIRGLLGSLGLPGRIASDVPVTKLSGGQLVRCQLARLFWKQPQCLVLDEVTTHLDYETVTALREALHEWEGAVVLVSHDRWFMRGALEGLFDEYQQGSEEEEGEGGAGGGEGHEMARRRRMVYRLKGGALVALQNGVQDFEGTMERRVKKLLEGM
ncbi:ABC transporter F family member 4 [Escovopsis weberi]|uniref:ABC transporter F family member 4 n=1 Tax=Escovopsis weberi TaxID=150374 RepID=A0A0M9VT11_ESCWE|nr:ABC transporter F family member 4 [Escovopsis weberi]